MDFLPAASSRSLSVGILGFDGVQALEAAQTWIRRHARTGRRVVSVFRQRRGRVRSNVRTLCVAAILAGGWLSSGNASMAAEIQTFTEQTTPSTVSGPPADAAAQINTLLGTAHAHGLFNGEALVAHDDAIVFNALGYADGSRTRTLDVQDPKTVTPSDVSQDQVFERLGKAFIAAGTADGLSIAVVNGGDIRFHNFGTVSRSIARRPSENTVYEIGSVSKIFTALLLAYAVTEGRVDLQDDVRRYLPGHYPNLEFEGSPVRLVDLADMTSALPDNIPPLTPLLEEGGPDQGPFLIAERWQGYTNAQFLADLRTAELTDRPGATQRHSSVAATLLGIILETIYGKRYEDLVARYIEMPLGMGSGAGNTRAPELASVYDGRGVVMPPLDARYILSAGGLRYSSSDMGQFILAQLAASEEAIRLSQQPTWGDPDSTAVGFNWRISTSIDSQRVLRTSGGTFGSGSYVEIHPGRDYGIVLLANRSGTEGPLGALATEAFREIHGEPAGLVTLEDALEAGGYSDFAVTVDSVRKVHPGLYLTEPVISDPFAR